MILSDAGKMVDEQWLALVDRFSNIELHDYSIMPNHFHCILEIVWDDKTVNAQNVGVPLVGTPMGEKEKEKGRPRGIAPTIAPTNAPTGYAPTIAPTGFAPTNVPTGYAQTGENKKGTQNDDGKPTNKTIGDMMDAFKSIVTVEYIHGVKNKGWDRFDGKLLQRDYYEHIIRDEQEYQRISQYIIDNPSKWKEDKFYYE